MGAVQHLLVSALIIVIAVISKTYQSPIIEGIGNSESGENAIGGPEETMIRSCELKDTYLAGYLDDDRKLSFETAARAELECNKEPNCEGLTFEPKIGKWTLRASSDAMDSKHGEVSMLKSCLDRMGLPKYTIEAKKHCYDAKKKEFANFEDAEKECSNDKTCGGIWNEKCEGARFFTCEIGEDWLDISSKSCVLTKTQEDGEESDNLAYSNPDYQNSEFDPDYPRDQPIEDRMNQIDMPNERANRCAPYCITCEPLFDLITERWCLNNCNRVPSDCPADLCKCT